MILDIKYIEGFIKIVETGTFQKAADEMFITQSTLSKWIQNLECQLQVTLFDRSQRTARLTESGRILYQQAPEFLAHYHRLLDNIGSTSHEINLAMLPIWEYYDLPRVILQFAKEYPQIDLTMQESQNAVIPQLLNQGTNTLGIFRSMTPEKEGWNYLTLCEDELVLVVPSDFPYKMFQQVSLNEFRDQPFILLTKATQLLEVSINACQQAGFFPEMIYQGSSGEALHYMVAQGRGVALFMKEVAQQQPHTNNILLHFDETVHSKLILAHNRNQTLNKAETLLWKFLEKEYT